MKTERNWTVMAFLAGDNSLSVDMVQDLKEMKEANTGPDKSVTVVAQFDSAGSVIPTQRFVITQASDDGRLEADVCGVTTGKRHRKGQMEPDGENTGDPRTLINFLRWGMKNYPAKHYMVILSGHGSGVDENLFLKDESSLDSLTLDELQLVFRTVSQEIGREIDIVGMDSCLMGMAEVHYQLRGSVRYVIANEGIAPNTGWPYHRILAPLSENPEMTPEQAAQMIVRKYTKYYSDYATAGQSTDISACRISGIDPLAESLKKLVVELREGLAGEKTRQSLRDALILTHWEAQTYKQDQYTDLYDFCHVLADRAGIAGITAACNEICKVLTEQVVIRNGYSGADFQYSYGLSIYFPWALISNAYRMQDFASETGWLDFLEDYLEATRRDPRPARSSNARLRPAPMAHAMAAGVHRYTPTMSRYTPTMSRYTPTMSRYTPTMSRYTPTMSRYTPTMSRYTPTMSRGESKLQNSIKNNPIAFFECVDEE
jgi:putative component of membrane protein insertase Oxa1/YidC/SpoIIIJ protein YidD